MKRVQQDADAEERMRESSFEKWQALANQLDALTRDALYAVGQRHILEHYAEREPPAISKACAADELQGLDELLSDMLEDTIPAVRKALREYRKASGLRRSIKAVPVAAAASPVE